MLGGIRPQLPPPSSQRQPSLSRIHLPSFRSLTTSMADSDSSDCAIVSQAIRQPFRSRTAQFTTSPSVIDLTEDAPPSPERKPSIPSRSRSPTLQASGLERPPKRRRITSEPIDDAGEGPSQSRTTPQSLHVDLTLEDEEDEDDVEELDLTGGDGSATRNVRGEQSQDEIQREGQLSSIIQEQMERPQGPVRLGQVQCVICMENMTDLTATHCGKSTLSLERLSLSSFQGTGHLFCHTCIMEALIAGERQSDDSTRPNSRCPVCRKKVLRNPKTAVPHVIPLELKFTTKTMLKGKARATD